MGIYFNKTKHYGWEGRRESSSALCMHEHNGYRVIALPYHLRAGGNFVRLFAYFLFFLLHLLISLYCVYIQSSITQSELQVSISERWKLHLFGILCTAKCFFLPFFMAIGKQSETVISYSINNLLSISNTHWWGWYGLLGGQWTEKTGQSQRMEISLLLITCSIASSRMYICQGRGRKICIE